MAGGQRNDYLSDHVHQATGLIAAQAHCEIAAALAMLFVRAADLHQTLNDTALDVLDGIVRFDL